MTTATNVSRQAQLPAWDAPFAPAYAVSRLKSGYCRRGTHCDDQNAAEDPGRHDEDSTREEDEEFEFLAPGKSRFEEHLWM